MPHPAFLQARMTLLDALREPSTPTSRLEEAALLIIDEASLMLLVTHDVGSPICGGPGKIKHVDRALIDAWVGFPSLLALEADWIGTTKGLYYVTPRAGNVLGWTRDSDIAGITKGRTIWKFGGVRVTTSGGGFDLRTGAYLVDVLLAMTARFTRRDAEATSPRMQSPLWVPGSMGDARRADQSGNSFHVALRPDGKGATFFLDRDSRGSHKWTWDYDPALVGMEFHFVYSINQATFFMDRAIGLPINESYLQPQIGAAGQVISEHSLVGYGDEKVPEGLTGWPWDEFRDST